jgi:hypothetical protein
MPLPTRPPSIDDDFYRQGLARRQDERLATASATRPSEMAKVEARNAKGQALASMYSTWAKEQADAKRKRDLDDVDKAIAGYTDDDKTEHAPKVSGTDWLSKYLGIKPREQNPMLGAAPPAGSERMYGYDARGPEAIGLGTVLDMRRGAQPAPIQAPPPERYTASGQAARENALTPAMLQALGRGNVTGAPQVDSDPAMAYDLMTGDAQAEANRRMRGVG